MDRINEIDYLCGSIPDYVLDIFRNGCCKRLAKVGIYNDDARHVVWDSSGCSSLKAFINYRKTNAASEGTCRCLCALRRITEAVIEAGEYLIEPGFLNFEPDFIFIDDFDNKAILLPVAYRTPFNSVPDCSSEYSISYFDSLIDICNYINSSCSGSSADIVAIKLQEKNSEAAMSASDILRFLSQWEMELKGFL